MSFVEFILRHVDEDSKFGDIARDVVRDGAVERKWGYTAFKRHLLLVGACDAVLEIVDDLREVYTQINR